MNLSLGSLMKHLDARDVFLECLLDCYRGAITDIRQSLVISEPAARRSLTARLDRLGAAVTRKANQESLALTAARLAEVMQDYQQSEQASYEAEQQQIRRTAMAIDSLVRTLAAQDTDHGAQLNAVVQHLESALFEGDLSAIHRTVQDQIRELQVCLVTISADAHARENALREQVTALHETVSPKQQQESTSYHQFAQTVLEQYIDTCTTFCLVLVKVENVAEMAKIWGTICHERLLAAVQRRLSEQLGAQDRLEPWDEGEFLIVTRSSLARTREWTERVVAKIESPYRVEVPFGSAQIEIRANIGIAEYEPGEQINDLLMRADLAAFRERHQVENTLMV